MNIKVTHEGIDYAVVNIGGAEFEVSKQLARALEIEIKKAKPQYKAKLIST